MPGVQVPAIVEEATKRSAVVWIELPGGTYPVWHVWQDGQMYVLTGGEEQPLPAASSAVVAVRSKDRPSELAVRWRADVEPVSPDSPAWVSVLAQLQSRRLNGQDSAGAPARWARDSVLFRFTPTGETLSD